MADKTTAPDPLGPFGSHPADAFILDEVRKKNPKAAEFDPNQTDPVEVLDNIRKQTYPDVPFPAFVGALRDRASSIMDKKGQKPYFVETKVETQNKLARGTLHFLKMVLTDTAGGLVGALRYTAAPLAELDKYKDKDYEHWVQEGMLPPISEAERLRGQSELISGALFVAAGAHGEALRGLNSLHPTTAAIREGILKNVARPETGSFLGHLIKGAVEGAGWGALFSGGDALARERSADEVRDAAFEGMKFGAALGAAGGAIGGAAAARRNWKLKKLAAAADAEQLAKQEHYKFMDEQPDDVRAMWADAGLRVRGPNKLGSGPGFVSEGTTIRGELGTTSERFTNIDLPDNVREVMDPDRIPFLRRADALLREKQVRLNYLTGELEAIKPPTEAPAVRPPQITETSSAVRELNPTQQAALEAKGLESPSPGELVASRTETSPVQRIPQDYEQEIAYRLLYGDDAYFQRSAEYDLLTPEQKGSMTVHQYMDGMEGSGAAKFFRNLEAGAKARQKTRAGRLGSTAFDVTAGSLEGAYDLADTAVIGAAKIFRLGHLPPAQAYRLWRAEMTQLLGDTAATSSAMHRVYTRSQKQLEKMIEKMAPEMRDVTKLMEKFNQGKPGMNWYDGEYEKIVQLFGEEDAPTFTGLLAIMSTGTNVQDNVMFALRDYARLKAGLPPMGGRFPNNQIPMIKKMLAGEPFGDQKVQNFFHTLMGTSGHSTNDIQVSRAFGWARESFSKNQYRFVEEVIRGLAKDEGVLPEQYQAALWATPKIEKAQEAWATQSKKQVQYVGSFRRYHELVQLRRAEAGIHNTLNIPSEHGGGGYTFDPNTLEAWKGKGYLATLYSKVVKEKALTPGTILSFLDEVRGLINKHTSEKNQFTVGLWRKGDGTVSIDFNVVTKNPDVAKRIGQETDQYAIGDMSTGSYEGDISTGKDPNSPQRLVKFSELAGILQGVLGG